MDEQAAFTDALVAELAKKTGVCWLTYLPPYSDTPVTRPAWHVWVDVEGTTALYVVSGGTEQPLPGIEKADRVEVTLRSKENGGRLVTWVADASAVRPDDPEWGPVTAALVSDRLNVPDLATAADGWAETSHVTRLLPTGELVEQPGALSDGAHLATPQPSPATTRGPLPKVLHRRVRRRPKLS
jgi:hypothetical protein